MQRIKRSILIIFILTLVTGQEIESGLKEGKSTAAVLDFEGSGITIQESQVLTQRLGSELVQTKALIMVERNQMSEIMDEQGFQQSGCTSAECAAEIGLLLGVKKMITGSFGKLGNTVPTLGIRKKASDLSSHGTPWRHSSSTHPSGFV